MKINKEDLINAIGRLPIGWSIEDTGEAFLLTTRESGNVGEETAGKSDIEIGRRILGILRKSFPDAENRSSAEVVDEWVIVSIGKGNQNKIGEFEKRIAWAFARQGDGDYPFWYINVLVESPSKKGFYLVGRLDGEYNYDVWDEKNDQQPILIYPKNGIPMAVKLPVSRDAWFTNITRRNHKLPSGGRLRTLLTSAIKRRLELDAAIDSRQMIEVRTKLARKEINYAQANQMNDKIRAQEFLKYKQKYLKEPRQITEDSSKFYTS